ncbi:TPA: hypothetical protein ACGD5G_000694 [Serratia marcescens]|nr:hypothetical protein SMKC031_24630 [Serratia marcescens]HBV9084940.1 hypothetical protein [Serratia marcescens]HEJ8005461.1 hypothetical protein [Serratia marcescens]
MIDRLELTKNIQFYNLIIPEGDLNRTITDVEIDSILDASDENIDPDGGYLINDFRVENRLIKDNIPYKYSLRIFPSLRPVYFIGEVDDGDNYQDKIYAFILILEFDNSIAIIKKSCSNISDKIEKNFNLVSSDLLVGTFNDSEVSFQKISTRTITNSDKAIRNRSAESADLKGSYSTHAAGRSIPYYLKLRQGAVIKTISGSGRLVEASQRVDFYEIAEWSYTQLCLIKQGGGVKDFLSYFAKQKELGEVLDLTKPNALLIESTSLYEKLQSEGAVIKYKLPDGTDHILNDKQVNRLLRKLERVYQIKKDLTIPVPAGKAKIRVNNKTLTIDATVLKKLKVSSNAKDVTLQNFIYKNGFYSITFTDPSYMYFMGNCFEDSSGVSEIDSILDMLTPQNNIKNVSSEKGVLSKGMVCFHNDSMFDVVEKIHVDDDYIFCDDLVDEWADHITFNKAESCICFIHSKHGDKSTSASKLHDVVGQGIKNLGYMYSSTDDFFEKIKNKFRSNYVGVYKKQSAPTKIKRIRKGNTRHIKKYLDEIFKDAKLHRKCILSCSFISKKEIKQEFTKLQKKEPVKPHVIQLLWILSSFSHAVKEVNAVPIIYCDD